MTGVLGHQPVILTVLCVFFFDYTQALMFVNLFVWILQVVHNSCAVFCGYPRSDDFLVLDPYQFTKSLYPDCNRILCDRRHIDDIGKSIVPTTLGQRCAGAVSRMPKSLK